MDVAGCAQRFKDWNLFSRHKNNRQRTIRKVKHFTTCTNSLKTPRQSWVPLLGCTKCWTQCSELDKWTHGLCGDPPHLFQSTQAVRRESNNFSFSSWKGLPSASVILSVQWSLPFLPPHTSLSKDMHLRRGSAGSSASYLDDQCHIKTPLSSNYIGC